MTIEEFDSYLNKNSQKITDRLLSKKVGISSIEVGISKRSGRNKNEKLHAVCGAFGVTKSCLSNYKRGTGGVQKQFLYKVLMALPFEVLNKINDEQ